MKENIHGCIVISLRPHQLPKRSMRALLKAFGPNNLSIQQATTPLDLGCQVDSQKYCAQHSSKITCIEWAIVNSHRSAQELSQMFPWETVTILEEDFMPRGELKDFVKSLSCCLRFLSKRSSPAGFHFFPEQGGIFRTSRTTDFLRAVWVPDFAVAYALNREGLAKVLSAPVDPRSVADWPKQVRKIEWWANETSVFLHPAPELVRSENHQLRFNRKRKRFEARSWVNRQVWVQMLIRFSPLMLTERIGNQTIENELIRSVVLRSFLLHRSRLTSLH
jgi:hypothetical protein